MGDWLRVCAEYSAMLLTYLPRMITSVDPMEGVTAKPKNWNAMSLAIATVRRLLVVLPATHARVTPKLPAPNPIIACVQRTVNNVDVDAGGLMSFHEIRRRTAGAE